MWNYSDQCYQLVKREQAVMPIPGVYLVWFANQDLSAGFRPCHTNGSSRAHYIQGVH